MLGTASWAMAPNHRKTNQNGVHSKTQCCDGQKQMSRAFTSPSFLVFPQTISRAFEHGLLSSVDSVCTPSPLCISYASVHNYYDPYTYCSLDKGVACAQYIQLPTHTCTGHMC